MISKLERVLVLIIQLIPIFMLGAIFLLLISFLAKGYGQLGLAIVGLAGVIVGAMITAGSKFLISNYDRHHQLRIAALEKRLQAHQEAFALWSKLVSSIYKPEIYDVFNKCQDWWYNNCLYLDGNARSAFREAYISALHHADYVKFDRNSEFLMNNYSKIISAGNVILESIMLPPIRDLESEIGADSLGFQGPENGKNLRK